MSSSEPVASPCINVCFLDERDICLGCFRSVDEIGRWWEMGGDERREVLARCTERRRESGAVL